MKKNSHHSQIIIYQTEDGRTNIDVQVEGETVWLTQKLMAELFGVEVNTINYHIKEILKNKELDKESTIRKIRIVQNEGIRDVEREVEFYNLDMIISVGYRVNSVQATRFRIWATRTLREYIIKGFAIDDERLKQGGSRSRYFEELLQRVRDIRASERMFYQKVTDIYATSIDYKKDDELTKEFFATVQNKMHFAVHGHTAAEIIVERANSKKSLMGLTSFKGNYITAGDVRIAKNYLTEEELNQLNLIVSLYLDFAELQAGNQRPMRMVDWINKLDEFLKLSEKKLLHSAGKVSAEQAREKADEEFDNYRKEHYKNYISDFDKEMDKIMKEAKTGKKGKKRVR